jgi:uncharacterized Zn finger protein (UPF0148 family)
MRCQCGVLVEQKIEGDVICPLCCEFSHLDADEKRKLEIARRIDYIKRMVPARETNAERLYRLSQD